MEQDDLDEPGLLKVDFKVDVRMPPVRAALSV